jgi:hypothetical protein
LLRLIWILDLGWPLIFVQGVGYRYELGFCLFFFLMRIFRNEVGLVSAGVGVAGGVCVMPAPGGRVDFDF